MAKQILYGTEARAALKRGVDKLADVVRGTLGAKGKPVLIYRGGPVWTLDGVTVAREVVLADPVESQGAEFIKQVAGRANDEAGDGTTTAIILGQEILARGLAGVESGIDPHRMRRGIERAKEIVLAAIAKAARPIRTEREMAAVATISSREREAGAVIARVFKKIGKDGIVAVEENREVGIREEIVNGLEIDQGMLSPYFTTNRERLEAVVEFPYVLVTTQVVSTNQDLIGILTKVAESDKKAVVVVAEDVTGEALATLALNKVQGRLKCLAVKAPGHGSQKREYLEDLAVVTGATLLSEEVGKRVEDAEIKDLGRCDLVIARKNLKTTFIGGRGTKADVRAHAAALRKLLEREENPFKKGILEKRHARVSGGVAVVKIGALTETEQRERHYRIEDAVNAVKAALAEGVVVGGGLALYDAAGLVAGELEREKDHAVRFGMETLVAAARAPARQVIENAGEAPDRVLTLLASRPRGDGWDAETGQFVNMARAGIIDPLKVVRIALESAVSVASYFLVAGAVVADEPEKKVEKKSDE